jgi:hypothetical protein
MTEHNRQFDDREPHVPDRLAKDLRGLFQPPGAVPARVDKAILDQVHRLAKPRHLVIRLRWAAGIATAAAVLALGVVLYNARTLNNQQSNITHQTSIRLARAEGRADIDGNGRVDILDAFRLARSIEARGPADPRWDFNGDGRVDKDDVDVVASAAVHLDSQAAQRDQAHLGSPTAALGGARNPAEGGRATTSVGCVSRTAVEQEGLGASMGSQTRILACADPLNKGV